MKKRDFEKLFSKNGWEFKRNGGNHDVWTNGKTSEQIPRHKEVNERLAKALIKKHGLR